MQLVYDRFETIESNLHKAYYHLEDVEPELLKFNERYSDDPDIDISGNNIIITFHEGSDSARGAAYSNFQLYNLLCIAEFRLDQLKSDANHNPFSSNLLVFINNFDPSLIFYITENKTYKSLVSTTLRKFDDEKLATFVKEFVNKLFGLEHILNYWGIFPDSATIKKGEEILAKDSALAFCEWLNQVDIKSGDLGLSDYYYKIISDPFIHHPRIDDTGTDFISLLEYCVKKNEIEYKEWAKQDYSSYLKAKFDSTLNYFIGKFSHRHLFLLYDGYVKGDYLDGMFYAMNAETSDGDLNRLLVEAVRNFPDPQFAIEVNERYNEYKRYNPGCIDLPFVDQEAEMKQIAPPVLQEDNTRNFDVRLGKYLEVSLESEDVAALYKCFYQMFDSETKRGDILYYLSTGADDGLVHNGIKWQGSRVGLALFLRGVLPPKKDSFWNNVYNVFRIKRNDEWVKTGSLNKINSREWDSDKFREECEKLESLYNNWMIKRPNLKGKWEFKDWRKKG